MTFSPSVVAAITLAMAVIPLPLSGQMLNWRTGMATSGTGTSIFCAAETLNVTTGQDVFLAGNGSSNFAFGDLQLLLLPSRPSGLLVGASRAADHSLTTNWQSRAESSQSVVFTDLALIPGTDQLAVCGRFDRDVTFKDSLLDLSPLLGGITLSPGNGSHGFVAVVDRKNGSWKSAFVTPGVKPESIACDSSGSILLTGFGTLAARFQLNGTSIWKTTATSTTTRLAQITVKSGSAVYVLGEETGAGVVLSALNPTTGAKLWTRTMGGPGENTAGGLDSDAVGNLHLTFVAAQNGASFGGVPIPTGPTTLGRTIYAAKLSSTGDVMRVSRVTSPNSSTGEIQSTALCNDGQGGTWLACLLQGSWNLNGADLDFSTPTTWVVHLDASGAVQQSFSARQGLVRCLTAAGQDQVIAVGDYSGSDPTSLTLPLHAKSGGFLATLVAAIDQSLWVARPNPDSAVRLTVPALRALLVTLGATPYAEVDVENGPQAVSFWGTPGLLVTLLADPRMILTPESYMQPSGTNPQPGWALARVGGSTSETAPYSFPDSTNPVRLYLIDTAVANPSGWIDANPKLTLEKSVLIRGSGDPTVSSQFKHGTQMLSLIGGLETGGAAGTPLQVVSYDVYPQGGTTSTTLLAKAITEAVKDYRNFPATTPAAICIATSSTTPATSYTLQSSIEMALSEGIPVIVSAGNLGAQASAYIPAAYGTMNGVICTGAADTSDLIIASSNRGPAVDLLAPGLDVRTLGLSPTSRFELMTGTSPAAGLAAAVALNDLSLNGKRTPSAVETATKAAARQGPNFPLLRLVPSPPPAPAGDVSPPAETPDGPVTDPAISVNLSGSTADFSNSVGAATADTDGDGVLDVIELFHGRDPAKADAASPSATVALTAQHEMQFTFPISKDLFDGSQPFKLRNGCTWRIRCSTGLNTWSVPSGRLAKSTDTAGRTWLTATFPAGGPACFARLEIVDPAAR